MRWLSYSELQRVVPKLSIKHYLQKELTPITTYFHSASDECPSFTVGGSTQGSWTASPIGTTVTIECAATHSLVESATLTCQIDRTWSNNAPQCNKSK